MQNREFRLHRKQLNRLLLTGALALSQSLLVCSAHANNKNLNAGILDTALVNPNARAKNNVQIIVRKEQANLRQESRGSVLEKAQKGERLAQIEYGSTFAREAKSLSFYPAAANAALSDALRWYSLAARRGFPGAASLDQSGVSFYPIRVYRNN